MTWRLRRAALPAAGHDRVGPLLSRTAYSDPAAAPSRSGARTETRRSRENPSKPQAMAAPPLLTRTVWHAPATAARGSSPRATPGRRPKQPAQPQATAVPPLRARLCAALQRPLRADQVRDRHVRGGRAAHPSRLQATAVPPLLSRRARYAPAAAACRSCPRPTTPGGPPEVLEAAGHGRTAAPEQDGVARLAVAAVRDTRMLYRTAIVAAGHGPCRRSRTGRRAVQWPLCVGQVRGQHLEAALIRR